MSGKLRALDLFCCAGGATRGLQKAGFHVTGVDIKAQPRYCGDRFILGDALEFPLDGFDLIWASPPCQAFTRLRHLHKRAHPNLIPQTRARLIASRIPWVMENVEDAPLGASGNLIMLCGTMFGLQTKDGRGELRRHRLFETSFPILLRPRCQHGYRAPLSVCGKDGHLSNRKVITVSGHTAIENSRVHTAASTGSPKSGHYTVSVTGSVAQANVERNVIRETFSVQQAREVMGIDWMSMKGLSQAIPPAYSQFIARSFLHQTSWIQEAIA